jgi:hypothetical protein
MEVSDDEFNVIRGTQATLEVTISSRGAHVQGTVTDADGLPAAGVWVVLVPGDARRNEFHLFKQVTTDQYGRFEIRGIAPGDYKVFSWEQVEQNAWEAPDFSEAIRTERPKRVAARGRRKIPGSGCHSLGKQRAGKIERSLQTERGTLSLNWTAHIQANTRTSQVKENKEDFKSELTQS